MEIGLVPFGSLGLTVFGVDLFLAARFPAGPGPAPGGGRSWARPGTGG